MKAGANGLLSIGCLLYPELTCVDIGGARLQPCDVVTVKSSRYELIECRVRQQVASDLFDRKIVERLVVVESPDHPVAVGIHLAIVVDVDAVGVSVTGGIKPIAGRVFTPVFRVEQPVDQPFIRSLSYACSGVPLKKLSRVPGSGGSPVRSSATRRASVRLLASAAGARPSASGRANTNRSSGLRTQASFFTADGAGRSTRLNDQ